MPNLIENESELAPAATSVLMEPNGQEKLPLSFAQQRLWFFSELAPDSSLYNIPTALRLKGSLNKEAFQKSWNAIIARHESLRTNFISDSGIPAQIIRPVAEIPITEFDLSKTHPDLREQQLREWLRVESKKPFDLESELLLRVGLVRMADGHHVLLLNMHHIISDEWSLRVLFHELAEFYGGFSKGNSPTLEELPIQYADHALWQRECLSGEFLETEIAYWKNQLADLTPLILPTDYPRPRIQTYNGDIRSLALPRSVSNLLNELSRQNGTTLFITLLAAFKALLYRYSGQDQITVGSPISGRNKIETENLIGFFVNTLVLRTSISRDMTFRELLDRVREMTLGAFAHQELPLEKLVEELQPERNAGQLSFLNAMFSLQNSSGEKFQLAGIESESLDLESNTAKFDLTFGVRENRDGLILVAEYNTDLFAAGTIERMVRHYARLLESIIENPGEKLSRLNILTSDERRALLIDWNKTETEYPRGKTVHELFSEQAAKSPEALAISYGDQNMSYRELEKRSNQLGHYLRQRGVGPDVLVGICTERSLETIVGFLGILKAGGAYVPLDVDYPQDRIKFMVNDAQCPVLLTQARLASRFEAHQEKLICLDSDWPLIAQEKESLPTNTTTSEQLAYVIYTSGSTGKPKGVTVPHRAINRLVFNTNYIQLDSSDRMAQASNSSFDAATFEIWGALLHGGALFGFNKETILSPTDFAAQLTEQEITTLFLTTALFNQIAADAPRAFGSLKTVLFGGEAVDPKSVRKILATAPPQRLLHVYGPTECTTFASWFEIKDVPETATNIPIGRPLSNTQFFVLDPGLQPVPVGIAGELFLGGDGLARGYFQRPELTAEKFIANPFEKNSLLYKTGDLVRYLPDGAIEFVGRVDHQVKIRGFRIELSEIETVLRQYPAINDALVLVRGENNDKQLVGYLLTSKSAATSVAELKQFLRQQVPDYMIPATFIWLENFPLTPNGKVDRAALPAPGLSDLTVEGRAEPLTDLEKRLKEIWEEVMDRKPIDVRANFFDLGGHSLMAVRLFAQIGKAIGKKLPLALLFQSPTIEQLAAAIEGDQPDKSDPCLIEIQPNGFRPPIFWLHTLGGGGGGGVLRYQKLSQLLGPEQPSYGLVAPPEPFTRIEAMAEHYIKVMRKIQPSGPYHLGGYCFGGIIAFEMAQQLKAANQDVALLALLDSWPPNVPMPKNINGAQNLPKRILRVLRQNPDHTLATLKRKSKRLAGKIFGWLDDPKNLPAEKRALEDVIDMENYPQDYKRYAQVHWDALLHYTPKIYPGKLTLLATFTSPETGKPGAVWKALAYELEVRPIMASHEKMLEEPHVNVVAAELNNCLKQSRNEEIKICAA